MDISVTDSENMPSKAYVSIRVGDTRRQAPYKPQESYRFPNARENLESFRLDVFTQIASKHVVLDDMWKETGVFDERVTLDVDNDKPPIELNIRCISKNMSPSQPGDAKLARHQAAITAKRYLDQHHVQQVLQTMMQSLLTEKPENPLQFMAAYLANKKLLASTKVPESDLEVSPYAEMPGLGDFPTDGFPWMDCPEEMPDLSQHSNCMAEVLRENPEIYHMYKDLSTKSGVTLAQCIKTGIDNPGHPAIKTVGAVFGDEESYELFLDLFDPIISKRHSGFGKNSLHTTDLDCSKLLDTVIDPSGMYVISTRVRTGRSINGFRLPPTCSKAERRELERICVKALLNLDEDLKGDYYPLAHSMSYAAKPAGMTMSEEEKLREEHFLFQEPDSTLLLASAMGRHWPDARGIFHNEAKNFLVWVNEEDHLRIISMEMGCDIASVFTRFVRGVQGVEKVIKEEGHEFIHSDRLGYFLTCPSNLGTGLRASVMVKIPHMSGRSDFKEILQSLGLQARGGAGVDSTAEGGVFDISNADRLGKSEVELVNLMISGCAQVIQMEQKLERGEALDVDEEPREVEKSIEDNPYAGMIGLCDLPSPGFADEAFGKFAWGNLPEEMPNLENHSSCMGDVLRENPDLYEKYRLVSTSSGVSLGHCIKTGLDNPGHPAIKTVGAVFGDEESYEVFKEIFDPIIALRNSGYPPDGVHTTDLDYSKISEVCIDPTGNYVISTRVRTGRSITGFRLPPCINSNERQELERICVKALLNLEGDLQGDYYPLAHSMSYAEKPNGMSPADEDKLREEHFLFQEPDSTLLLASGMGRDWPNGRGIFHNEEKNFLVWVNEEDHLRIISMEMGCNILSVFSRFCRAVEAVQNVIKEEGHDFMHSEHLGYIHVCPSNLGTGLRASVMVKIPLLSQRPDFKEICLGLKLQARGSAGVDSTAEGGVWDISNSDRLGKSEVELVNLMIEGCTKIVEMEQKLERGESIESDLPLGETAVEEPNEVEEEVEETKEIEDPEEVEDPKEVEETKEVEEPKEVEETQVVEETQEVEETKVEETEEVEKTMNPYAGMSGLCDRPSPGLADEAFGDFNWGSLPEEMPNLENHSSCMADVLRENPELYEKYRLVSTANGISLGHCIKTGLDNPGHPAIKIVGAVFGDEESYETFKEIFDPIISLRHSGYPADGIHSTDLDYSKLLDTCIDPTGNYVISTRVRTGRSITGFRLPPCIMHEEKTELERVCVKALLNLKDDLKGDYYPLAHSTTYAEKPFGMSPEEEEKLREEHFLFQEPDSTLLLASGMGRDWPNGRGIFHNEEKNFLVWVNEEDHLRIISMEMGCDIRSVFTRFCRAVEAVQKVIKEENHDFMHSDHLGYFHVCPSNLGTGLRASIMVKLPLLSKQPDFKEICSNLKLQARGSAGVDSTAEGGVWDISNSDRLGKSEVELVNLMIEGCAKIVKMEEKLERGESLEEPTDSEEVKESVQVEEGEEKLGDPVEASEGTEEAPVE